MLAAHIILWSLAAYALAGLLFAIPFLARGLSRIDPAAHGAHWAFRLLITPGVIALWPILALRWLAAAPGPDHQ
jgi:hypothetical protein